MKNLEEKKSKAKVLKIFMKLFVVLLILAGIAFGIKFGPNYISKEITNKTNLVINYSNVTGRMKQDVIVDNDVIYLSLNDIMNYYDKHAYYDKQYNQIVTSSDTKLAVLKMGENSITVNGKTKNIKGAAFEKDGIYYLPISEMEEVYDIKVVKKDNRVIVESLDRKLTTATTKKKVAIKYKPIVFSKTLEKVNANEKVVIAEVEANSLPNGWVKVRTEKGIIGYVEKKNLNTFKVEREQKVISKQIEGKVSIAWEYFSEYFKAPDNSNVKYEGVNVVSPSFFNMKLQDTGKDTITMMDVVSQSKIIPNVGDEGVRYINWAHNNGYKVWAKVSNDTLNTTIDEFSYIINDYQLRSLMISDILNYVDQYKLDGINLDFEYMYMNDSTAFSKFVIELAPQLREKGAVLSVDVTAPNGAENWSMCYDRHLIGEIADYVVFMGYDQYGASTIGTTSGYNWLVNSIKSMLTYDEVPAEKLILGLPFYTKLWQTKNDQTIKGIAIGMNSVSASIPANVEKQWKEDLQQYYVEYEQKGYVYKMWIEDEKSFAKKIDLVHDYNLAGAGYWRKGLEPSSIWDIIKGRLHIK
ncbi:MAG: hypothetical protein K6B70_00500 [Clostridia bacterium]|nr:hypothetical protein [Clostridia bacterium]